MNSAVLFSGAGFMVIIGCWVALWLTGREPGEKRDYMAFGAIAVIVTGIALFWLAIAVITASPCKSP